MEFNQQFLDDTLVELKRNYSKILRVDLLSGKYEPIIVDDYEWCLTKNKTYLLQNYFEWFTNSEFLHTDDRECFIRVANIENIRNAKKRIYSVYRRKISDTKYHWTLMEICPNTERNYAAIYVKDIHDIYTCEYDKLLDTVCSVDCLTSLRNRFGFERDRHRFSGNVGVIYCDVNGLKRVNDLQGHKAGDKLLTDFARLLSKYFQDDLCYRFGGDEFVVICNDETIRDFRCKVNDFIPSLQDIACVGYSVDTAETLNLTMCEAETQMQQNKNAFHLRQPR